MTNTTYPNNTAHAAANNLRTADEMSEQVLKGKYKSIGYQFKGPHVCEACETELLNGAQSQGYTGNTPYWGNANCAYKFHRKGSTVAACRCGWRKNITIKHTPVKKAQCKVRGCNHILNKTDNDGLCVPCRNKIAGGGNPATYSAGCKLKPSGCTEYMQCGRDSACIAAKCKHYDAIPVEKAYVTCKCGNVLPKGRKQYCYTCRKPTTTVATLNEKEAVSTKPPLNM